ncbi:MAG: hypothetical protein NT150_06650 [Bacteroidetes bacterium]|nr:hypothetical protein [Bacteroidota bacterium]
MAKAFFVLFLSVCFYACKQTTTKQVIIYNDSDELLKVKVHSSLDLPQDSFSVNAHGNFELYFKEEEGLKSGISCLSAVDSVFTYSATNKMKIKIVANDKWGNLKGDSIIGNSKHEFRCILYVGKGDTIQ